MIIDSMWGIFTPPSAKVGLKLVSEMNRKSIWHINPGRGRRKM